MNGFKSFVFECEGKEYQVSGKTIKEARAALVSNKPELKGKSIQLIDTIED